MIVEVVAVALLGVAFIVFAYGLRVTVGTPWYLRKRPEEDIPWVLLISFFLLFSFTTTVAIGTPDSIAYGLVTAALAGAFAGFFASNKSHGGGEVERGWEVWIDPWDDRYYERPLKAALTTLPFLHFFVPATAFFNCNLRLGSKSLTLRVEVSLIYERHGAAEFVRRQKLFQSSLEALMRVHYHISAIERTTGVIATRQPLLAELQAIGRRLGLTVRLHGEDPLAVKTAI